MAPALGAVNSCKRFRRGPAARPSRADAGRLAADLGEQIARIRQELSSALASAPAALGSPDPPGDSSHLLALVDGLLAGRLADPMPDFDPAKAIAALLRGLTPAAL